MLDLVVVDGKARGIIVRNLVTGELERYAGDAVILATGGYGTVYYLSTNAVNSNVTAAWRAHKRGALFANPCFTQIHPTCIPVSGEHQSKLTLMSESLRNDGRVWVPKKKGDTRPPEQIPEDERDYYLERKYPSFGNLVPRDVASRNAKQACDEGRGVGESGLAVYLDFKDAIQRLGPEVIKEKYGNLFQMYQKITDEDPYKVPMRIYPAIHYTMGGLWVDYNLMSTIPGLHVLGEANFSDHGANRLGASALMQGLADGYFVIPYTIGDYLASSALPEGHRPTTTRSRRPRDNVQTQIDKLLSVKGNRGDPRDPPRARAASCGTTSAWRAPRQSLTRALERDSEAARRVLAERLGARRRRQPESEPRIRRPRRRLPRVRRTARPRRAASAANRAAAISARRARRPTARRCATTSTISYVAAWEFTGVGSGRSSTRSRSSSTKCIRRSGATSRDWDRARDWAGVGTLTINLPTRITVRLNLKIWRQAGPTPPAGSSTTPLTTSRPTCRSSRCSTSSTKG